MRMWRPRLALAAVPPLILGMLFVGLPQVSASVPHRIINCQYDARCLEVHDPQSAGFEYYVGHDEPSMLFYSNQPGSGNNSTYQLTLPKEPAGTPNANGSSPVTWDFQLHPAFWFGMILCNAGSYPEQTKNCTRDSNSNITTLDKAPGQSFLELQFYPPGYFPTSCTSKRWCVAMVIWSLAEDPINGTVLNATCTSQIGSLEYPNLAYLTKSGHPTGPANAVDLNGASFTPTSDWLLMNEGDKLSVSIHDTANGLQTVVQDHTTGVTGSMTASAANSFGYVDYQPNGSACTNVPYDFHPEYSTSSPPTLTTCPSGVYPNVTGGNAQAKVCTKDDGTRVQWAAHSYNVSFADEIGHWDWCSSIVNGHCAINGKEGAGWSTQNDGDSSNSCFTGAQGADFGPANTTSGSDGPGIAVPGCLTQNDGFDGGGYQAGRWAPASTAPTPITFSSPTTGTGEDAQPYQQAAFEANIPRITALNATDYNCSRSTGTQVNSDPVTGAFTNTGIPCAIPPKNDTGGTAFYPTFGHTGSSDNCQWVFGNYSSQTGGAGVQYGHTLFKLDYLPFGGGANARQYLYEDARTFAPTGCGVGGGENGGGNNG
jgi:hypothetical protein